MSYKSRTPTKFILVGKKKTNFKDPGIYEKTILKFLNISDGRVHITVIQHVIGHTLVLKL